MTHTLDAQSHCIQMTCRPEAPLVLDIDESRLLSHEATKFPLADGAQALPQVVAWLLRGPTSRRVRAGTVIRFSWIGRGGDGCCAESLYKCAAALAFRRSRQ